MIQCTDIFKSAVECNENKIVCLFPPSSTRLAAIDELLNEGKECPERYLFYGLDTFQKLGISVVHNIKKPSYKFFQRSIRYIHRAICGKLFIFYGEIEWVFPVWKDLYRRSLWFVFSERIMLAISYWQMACLLPRRPTIFIPMGLPEKLNVLRSERPLMCRLVVHFFKKIDYIICVSKLEEQILNNEYGIDGNTIFIPAGVDNQYFRPINLVEDVDVLSIGADRHRDFNLLFESARRLKYINFRIITTQRMAAGFENIPKNVEVYTDVSMREIRQHIARAGILALPVIPNSYSGATTVLLQAMAMGKAVIANKEGANTIGYPFYNNENVVFVPSQNLDELSIAIANLVEDVALRKRIGEMARKTVVKELDLLDFHIKLLNIIKTMSRNKGRDLQRMNF